MLSLAKLLDPDADILMALVIVAEVWANSVLNAIHAVVDSVDFAVGTLWALAAHHQLFLRGRDGVVALVP